MRNIILLLLVIATAIGCSPAALRTANDDPSSLARVLVGTDDGGKMLPAADDIRIKRVTYLLDELARKTGEQPVEIAIATDGAADRIEKNYGRRVTREKLLEQMNEFFSDPKLKGTTTYKDAIAAKVILEYAK